MIKFEIAVKSKRKSRHNKATPVKIEGDTVMEKIWQIKHAKKDSKWDTKTSNRKLKMQSQYRNRRRQQKKAVVAAPATAAQMTEVAKSEESEVTAAADEDVIIKKDVEATGADSRIRKRRNEG